MKETGRKVQSFQFVSGLPPAADDAAKAKQRRLIRSNAANFQWSRQKNRRVKASSRRKEDEESPLVNEAGEGGDAPFHGGISQVTGLGDAQSEATSSTSASEPSPLPSPSSYSNLSLLPQNQIGLLMKFSQ
jgi:hypothetical protein